MTMMVLQEKHADPIVKEYKNSLVLDYVAFFAVFFLLWLMGAPHIAEAIDIGFFGQRNPAGWIRGIHFWGFTLVLIPLVFIAFLPLAIAFQIRRNDTSKAGASVKS